jgi:hypothetical protein
MAKRKHLLPFGWAPGHWGLAGKTRELAQAEYELDGEDLDRARIEINIAEKTEKEVELALLKLDHKYGRISTEELEKQTKTALDEPFVRVVKIETDPRNPAFGGIIFDYNEAFVMQLEEHGYGPHPDQDDTVNEWFNELCKNIALEAFDGLGDFTERVTGNEGARRSMSSDVILTEQYGKQEGTDE